METQVHPLVALLATIGIFGFVAFIIFMIRLIFVILPRSCISHNPIFYQPSSTSRPNGFDQQFCKVLYDLGKLCGIDGSKSYEDDERKLDNDITPINGSYPGYHHITLKNGVEIVYGIDYYDGSKKIFRKRATYKGEPIPETTANKLLKHEYDFFKSMYDKEREKRNAEIAALAS